MIQKNPGHVSNKPTPYFEKNKICLNRNNTMFQKTPDHVSKETYYVYFMFLKKRYFVLK